MDMVRPNPVGSQRDLLHHQLVRLPDPHVPPPRLRELLRGQEQIPRGASQAGEELRHAVASGQAANSIAFQEGRPCQGEGGP